MSTVVQRYTDEIHDQFQYWATWLPITRVRLGDAGPVRDRVFSPELNLADLGVELDVLAPGDTMNLQHSSKNGVQVTFQASGGNQAIPQVPQGEAGIEISFARENGIVFVVRDGRQRRVRDVRALSERLLDFVNRGDLPREYAVVTHVVDAASATVLISSSSNAKYVASAKVDLRAGLLDLANVGAGFSVVTAQNLQTNVVAEQGATPLLKLAGFKRGGLFWGAPRVVPLGFEDEDPGELSELALADADPEESAE